MRELDRILALHVKRYPKARVVDFVKLVYQNEYAGGHFIPDPSASLSMLLEEWEFMTRSGEHAPLYGAYEEIGNGLCRANITAFERKSLIPLNEVFVRTANAAAGKPESFLNKLEYLKEFFGKNDTHISYKNVSSFLRCYVGSGCPVPRHSPPYTKFYKPAYRVVSLFELSRILYKDPV